MISLSRKDLRGLELAGEVFGGRRRRWRGGFFVRSRAGDGRERRFAELAGVECVGLSRAQRLGARGRAEVAAVAEHGPLADDAAQRRRHHRRRRGRRHRRRRLDARQRVRVLAFLQRLLLNAKSRKRNQDWRKNNVKHKIQCYTGCIH